MKRKLLGNTVDCVHVVDWKEGRSEIGAILTASKINDKFPLGRKGRKCCRLFNEKTVKDHLHVSRDLFLIALRSEKHFLHLCRCSLSSLLFLPFSLLPSLSFLTTLHSHSFFLCHQQHHPHHPIIRLDHFSL